MANAQRDIKRKLRVFAYADEIGNVSKACRYFNISRETFYKWKRSYAARDDKGLINSKPCPRTQNLELPFISKKKSFIYEESNTWGSYVSAGMERYQGIRISPTGVYHVLKRNGLNRLPRDAKKRTLLTKRYEKQVPGHHIQVDVKFLMFKGSNGKKIKRYQYTAIDDATRIRA